MADWTTTRLIGVSVLLLTLLLLPTSAKAWVKGYQPFPEGEATVVLHRFCGGDCFLEDWRWRGFIRDAVLAWNTAGANFVFRTRHVQSTDDPCHLPNEVVIISYAGAASLCPGDGPLPRVPGPVGLTEFRLDGARIYLHAGVVTIPRLLIHELGHVVGLGHPDEAGQDVQSIMNSHVTHETLQPDDIAGIQALYGVKQDDPRTAKYALENPVQNAVKSGVGLLSGWVCSAEKVEIRFNSGLLHYVPHGSERMDTEEVWDGNTDKGFGLLINYNNLGDGVHVASIVLEWISPDANRSWWLITSWLMKASTAL